MPENRHFWLAHRSLKTECVSDFKMEWCPGAGSNHRHRDFQVPWPAFSTVLDVPNAYLSLCANRPLSSGRVPRMPAMSRHDHTRITPTVIGTPSMCFTS